MHLEELRKESSTTFKDRKWHKATFLEWKSNKKERTYLATIPKKIYLHRQAGFIYLLQKICYELENWDASEEWTLTNFQFLNFVFQEGYVVNKQGESVAKNLFLKNIGPLIGLNDLVPKKEIELIWAFDKRWNNQQYLIETSTNLCYLDWGTTN